MARPIPFPRSSLSRLVGRAVRTARRLVAGRSRAAARVPRTGHRPFRARRTYGLIALAGLLGIGAWTDVGPPTQAPGRTLTAAIIGGRASVIDGDTLEVRGERIRLHGIDAPETTQVCQDGSGRDYRCGRTAGRALSDKIGGRRVSCERRAVDRYGRVVAVCRAGGQDLNRWLVRQGMAIAYGSYSVNYVPAEIAARLDRRGIWAGTFVAPEKWRRQNRWRRSPSVGKRRDAHAGETLRDPAYR